MRSFAAVALAVLAAVSLVIASAGLWGNRTLNDSERFNAAVTSALDQPEVNRLIAREAVDALIDEVPALESVRGPLTRQSARILRQERVRDTVAALGTSAFSAIVEGRRQAIVVDVDAAVPAVQKAANRVSPELAAQIPDDPGLGKVELLKAGELPDLSPVADGFVLAAVLGGLLAAAALAIALAIARDRGAVLAVFGAALAAVSLIVLVGVGPIAAGATAGIPDDTVRSGVDAIVDSLLGPLKSQTVILLIAGAIVTVAGFFLRNGGVAGPGLAPTRVLATSRR